MDWLEDAWKRSDLPRPVVATIGNYDGIHRGQRAILERVVLRARALGVRAAVITFEPHPLRVVAPERAPRRLDSPEQKRQGLEAAAIDAVLEVRFDPEVAQTSAEVFVRDFLHGRLGVLEIYVGSRFAFGRSQEGDLALLQRLGEDLGFAAFGVPEVAHGEAPISSSRIRRAVAVGEVSEAGEMLGRPFALRGTILAGERRGKGLGFPTINLAPEQDLIPARGVYVSEVRFTGQPHGERRSLPAVTNVGVRPTLTPGIDTVVESHILDFASDVYGETVELGFLERLRDERAFDDVEALRHQIQLDVERARSHFAGRSHAG